MEQAVQATLVADKEAVVFFIDSMGIEVNFTSKTGDGVIKNFRVLRICADFRAFFFQFFLGRRADLGDLGSEERQWMTPKPGAKAPE